MKSSNNDPEKTPLPTIPEAPSWKDNASSFIWIAVFSILALGLCYLLSLPSQNALDNFLESGGLLTFSSLASFLFSKMLSEIGFTKTLRDHGVQIASNIMMLKNQTRSLTKWVAKKRSLYKENSLRDAELDHIQETLQGFMEINDATLKGVAGIIGDALAQYRSTMDQISVVRDEASKKTEEIQNRMQFVDSEEASVLRTQIEQIETESEKKVLALTAQTRLPVPLPPIKKIFSKDCPYCSKPTEFEMLHRPGQTNFFFCKHCRGRFNAHIDHQMDVFLRPQKINQFPKTADKEHIIIEPAKTRSLPRIEIQFKNEKPFSQSRDWLGNNKKFETVKILQETKFRIDPTAVTLLCSIFTEHDKKLRASGLRTPSALCNNILLDTSKTISNMAVRNFIKILMEGDAFKFEEGNPSWKTPYSNDLEEQNLLTNFLEGSIKRIKNIRPITEADSEWLGEILLGNEGKNEDKIINQLIKKVN